MLLCSLMACTKPGREAASAPHATRLPAIAAVSSRCAYALSFAAPVACPLSPCLRSDVNKTLGQYSFRVVKPESHLEERCLRGSQPTRVPYFTNSISVGRQVLSKNNSCWLWRRRNILHLQCFDWNAKPLRGGGAFRKQRNMQWRMVGQHGVQFWVVGSVGARDVERRLDRRMRRKDEAAVQRDVKDEPEIEIDRVERR